MSTNIFLLICLFLISYELPAEIFKCPSSDGRISYSDKPCKPETQKINTDKYPSFMKQTATSKHAGDSILELTAHAEQMPDASFLFKSKFLAENLVSKFELPESRKKRLLSINPTEVIQKRGELNINQGILKNKLFVVHGNANIDRLRDSILIASGTVSITYSINNIIVSGGSIEVTDGFTPMDRSRDGDGSLIISKGRIDLDNGNSCTLYAVKGLAGHGKNISLYNTNQHLNSKIAKLKIPSFTMPPLFDGEPARKFPVSNFVHSDTHSYQKQFDELLYEYNKNLSIKYKKMQQMAKEDKNREQREKFERLVKEAKASGKPINESEIQVSLYEKQKISLPIEKNQVRDYTYLLEEKYRCCPDECEAIRGGENTCMEYAHYNLNNTDFIQVQVNVGSRHPLLENAFSADSTDEHYRLLSKLYFTLEDKWGGNAYLRQWREGILQNEMREFFKDYEEIDLIVDTLSKCTTFSVRVLPEKGNLYLRRDMGEKVRPQPSKEIAKAYDYEGVYLENQDKEFNPWSNRTSNLKCLSN